MAATKLKKSSWGRRRFVKSASLTNIQEASDVAQGLKDKILKESAYQLVGKKIIIAQNVKSDEAHVLVEVLGIPRVELPIQDSEAQAGLIFAFEESVFDVDFLTVKSKAQEIIKGLSYSLNDNFHIVLEGEKLALHFFIQKDYIQS